MAETTKSNKDPIDTMVSWVYSMTLSQFNVFCGSIRHRDTGKIQKWIFWPCQERVAIAFNKFKFTWVAKSRQLGLSELAGEYAFKVASSEPGCDIIVISQKKGDAKYFLKRRIAPKIRYAYNIPRNKAGQEKSLFPWPNVDITTERITFTFPNGEESTIEAVSCDSDEARSKTCRLVIFDEARKYARNTAAELWSSIRPTIQKQRRGQAIIISTGRHGSWFNDITKKIRDNAIQMFEFIFLNVYNDPDMTDEKLENEAKNDPAGRTMYFLENPRNIEDMFAAREGAVWPSFDPKMGGAHINSFSINFRYRYIVAYDHGTQHPAVFLFMLYDKHSDHLYIFDEIFMRGLEIPEICMEIRTRMGEYKRDFPDYVPPQRRIIDRSAFNKDGRRTIHDWLAKNLGMTFTPCMKHDMEGSIDLVSIRMHNNCLTIDPRCKQTIKQVEEWVYKSDPKMVKKSIPVDVEDDSCFMEGTKITMADGTRKPIEEIKQGDIVVSHLGNTEVCESAMVTGIKDVYLFESNLFCTRSHKVFNGEFFERIESAKWLIKMDSQIHTIKGINTFREIDTTATLTAIGDELMGVVRQVAGKFITMYGFTTTANLIERHLSSTIRTEIEAIIPSKIWKSLQSENIASNIEKRVEEIWRQYKTNAVPGTEAKPVKRWLLKTSREFGRAVKIKLRNVLNVLKSSIVTNSSRIVKETTTVLPSAEHNFVGLVELMMLKNLALIVRKSLSETNMLRCVIVVTSALGKRVSVTSISYWGRLPVWNFKTEHGTYVANGFLVSNCDLIRYVCSDINGSPKPKKVPKDWRFTRQARIERERIRKELRTPNVIGGARGDSWQAG